MQRLTTRLRRRGSADERGATAVLVSPAARADARLRRHRRRRRRALRRARPPADRRRRRRARRRPGLRARHLRRHAGHRPGPGHRQRRRGARPPSRCSAATRSASPSPAARPKEHWFAPVIGHDSTRGLRHGHRRLGRPQRRHGGAAADLLLVRVRAADRRRAAVDHDRSSTICFTKTSRHRLHRAVGQRRARWLRLARHRRRAPARRRSALDGNCDSEHRQQPAEGCSTGRLRPELDGQTRPAADLRRVGRHRHQRLVPRLRLRRLHDHRLLLQRPVNTGTKACGPGNGSDRCVTGYFTRFVELSDAFDYSPDAPQLGACILRLIR